MTAIALRYLASREWMESEILAGNAIRRRDQRLSIDLSQLDPTLCKRVEDISDGIISLEVRKKQRICVLDSGIDPELSFGPTKEELTPLDASIVEAIGVLPELPTPSDDIDAVVEAWERWLDAYRTEALKTIDLLNADPPTVVDSENPFVTDLDWGPVEVSFGEGLVAEIALENGPKAVRDAYAGELWRWAAARRFSSESYAAAKEATEVAQSEGRAWLSGMNPEKLAARFVDRRKQLFHAAKAHHLARRAKVPDFEVEMTRWAEANGSDRLRLGIEDGYRMNARYLTERLAAEAPGMYAMPASSAQNNWAYKAGSPSEPALRLRRRIAAAMSRNAPPNLDGQPTAEIMIVKNPPHEIFLKDSGIQTEDGVVGTDLPSREAWPWSLDRNDDPIGLGPRPFEAVVVKHWLGRFHLIGAVAGELGGPPPGIWAVPDPDLYGEDGVVSAQDPDGPLPSTAKRKPPEPEEDDDIPF